ncbi:helix-turn-helix domain-containing protein [Staphylococcus haemolyticus]
MEIEIDKIEVGKRIKNIRLNNRKNLREFGELISHNLNEEKVISDSIVSRWEKGVSIPSAKRLKEIADIGNVTINFLLYGENVTYEEIENNLKSENMKELFKSKLIDFLDNYILKDNPSNQLGKTLELLDIIFEYEVADIDMLIEKLYNLITNDKIRYYKYSMHTLFNESFDQMNTKLFLTEFVYQLLVQLSLENPKVYVENLLLQFKELKMNISNISIKDENLNKSDYTNNDELINKLANFIEINEYIDLFVDINEIMNKIREGKLIDD